MNDSRLAEILSQVKAFPTMPEAGAKMLSLLEEPHTEISDIEEILRCDPGLTANILKLANSAYFGIPSKIGSLKQAVMVLGFRRLVQLVVASCVSAVMDKSVGRWISSIWPICCAIQMIPTLELRGTRCNYHPQSSSV